MVMHPFRSFPRKRESRLFSSVPARRYTVLASRFRGDEPPARRSRRVNSFSDMRMRAAWRSGAPLVLAPEKDDPALGADYQRNNNFNYAKMYPQGYAIPLGAHIRRTNPRDTASYMQRRRMIRRGATYGPPLPEGAPEDGVDRGIAAFILCASLVRQFEFAQNVWINDRNFHELGNERNPLIANQDGTFDFTMPKRPIRKKITGMPASRRSREAHIFCSLALRR